MALEDVDLVLPGGALVCFLGPSGCGKTTLLRIIAGLETPTTGQLHLGDRDLTHVPVHRRDVGMVFQSYALFPHLSVAENVAYGLRIRGVGRRERLARAQELLELVKLPEVATKRIAQLSGGMRQRVAMARALALDPALFLLDEPLSALDAKLREGMQVELRRLQRRLGITTIIVTHDQEEAMAMADLIVVMGDNRVQQVGAPLDIYRRPANRFVASFVGRNNFLPALVRSPDAVEVLGVRVAAGDAVPLPAVGSDVVVAARPESLRLRAEPREAPVLRGSVSMVRDLGRSVETHVRVGEHELVVSGRGGFREGDEVVVEFPEGALVVLRA